MAAISVKNLRKVFKRRSGPIVALDDISLDILEGEIFGYLGPNGAGKTTTIKIILGLVRQTSGDVRIFDRPVDTAKYHTRIGYIPEEHAYYPHLRVKQFLKYFAGIGNRKRGSKLEIDRVVDTFDLSSVYDRKLGDLSLGWRQKAALAATFLDDPDILILDEPTNGLDPVAVRNFVQLLGKVKNDGKTVLFSSHRLSEVERTADRVGILNKGRLVKVEILDDLLDQTGAGSLDDIFIESMQESA